MRRWQKATILGKDPGGNLTEEILLRRRNDAHMARRLWHSLGVTSILILYLNLTQAQALKFAAVITFLFVALDLLRQHIPTLNRILIGVFRPFMRESERYGIAGTSALLLAVFLLIFFYPHDVVVLSLLFLAFADPLASYVGVRYGKDKILKEKSLQGTLAAFAICALTAGVYFFFNNLM
ncbi:MAG: hypothetical protein KDD22_06455, partial [Bdellovibrionales bacterium]|nr:hypothetical protein [Bdellovibrionales bacterium]